MRFSYDFVTMNIIKNINLQKMRNISDQIYHIQKTMYPSFLEEISENKYIRKYSPISKLNERKVKINY